MTQTEETFWAMVVASISALLTHKGFMPAFITVGVAVGALAHLVRAIGGSRIVAVMLVPESRAYRRDD